MLSKPKRHPTFSFCSLAFRSQPIEEVLQCLSKIGYPALEIIFPHVEKHSAAQLASLRDLAQKQGIRLLVISPYFFLTRDQKAYDETLATARRVVETARLLGIPKVRTFTDAGPDAPNSRTATEAQWSQAIRGLKKITSMAPDLEFVVETHEYSLADRVESCQRIIRETNAPNLKLNFQHTSDFLRKGYFASLDALFPWITHMHLSQAVKDHGHGWVEEKGEIDFPALFHHLKNKNYQGTFSIEYCWANVPWERAETAFHYIRHLLQSY